MGSRLLHLNSRLPRLESTQASLVSHRARSYKIHRRSLQPTFGDSRTTTCVLASSLTEITMRSMLSLETIGYYSDKLGSQQYPLPQLSSIYPLQGNFISFIANVASGSLVRDAIASFRRHSKFPSEGTALRVGWNHLIAS